MKPNSPEREIVVEPLTEPVPPKKLPDPAPEPTPAPPVPKKQPVPDREKVPA